MRLLKKYSSILKSGFFFWFLPLLYCLLINNQALGQKKCKSLLGECCLNEQSLWKHTSNFASACLDSFPEIRRFSFYYDYGSGNFNKQADADNMQQYGFNTYGNKYFDKIEIGGRFTYKRVNASDINWTMRLDPNEENPLVISDSIGGDWLKEYFFTNFHISSKKRIHGFLFSFLVKYNIGNGGRDNDPRPENRQREYVFLPNVTWSNGNHWTTGFTGIFGSDNEEISIDNLYGVGGNLIYKINGLFLLGDPVTKSTLDYLYSRNSYGLAWQAGYYSCRRKIVTEIKYTTGIEEALFSRYTSEQDDETYEVISTASLDSKFLFNRFKYFIGASKQGVSWNRIFQLNAEYFNGKSYIVSNDQVEYVFDRLILKPFFHLYKKNADGISAMVGIDLNMKLYHSEAYYYGHMDLKNAGMEISYALIPVRHSNFSFEVGGKSGYLSDLNSQLIIDPQTVYYDTETAITNPLVRSDLNVLSTSYFSQELSFTGYLELKGHKKAFIKTNGEIIQPLQDYQANFNLKIETGILF